MGRVSLAAPEEGAAKEGEHIGPEFNRPRARGGVALGTLATLGVFYTLYFAASIILPFVLAVVLFLLLSPLMRLLSKRLRLPRTLSALILILLLFVVVAGLTAAISVPASGWVAKAPDSLPMLEKKLGFMREPIIFVQRGIKQLTQLMERSGDSETEPRPAPQPLPASPTAVPSISSLSSVGGSILATTGAALGQVFTVMLLLFFLLSSGDTLLRRLVEVLPTWEDKRRAVEIAGEIERNVAGYLATITMMNALVGVLAGSEMWLLGLPDPLLFGTMAFLLNYIPIIGPVIGIVCFFFVGLFSFDNFLPALVPAGVYLGIHILEGETITPMLLARRLTLNPVLVIASLLFWDWLWGVPGALLSVPLLAVFKIVCDHLPGLHGLGHMLGANKWDPKPAEEEEE
jgi:predicted PurR-regulated permease PerM